MDFYTILLGSGLFACTYFCLFPKKFKQKCYDISWYSVNTYHKTSIFLKDLFLIEKNNKFTVVGYGPSYDISSSEEEEEEEEPFIFLDGFKSNEIESLKIYENNDLDMKTYDLLFLEHFDNEKKYYKQLNLDENISKYFEYELKLLPRQFLQIEVIYDDDEKYDIHEYISKYYVEGNILFDPLFMNYYMKKWYNVDYDHNDVNYKVNIIDKDIKLLNLEKNVHLLLEDETYKRIDE